MVSHGGVVPRSSLICVLVDPTFRGWSRTWGGEGTTPLYFGVALELMRNVLATSSERTCQGHFVARVDFRVRFDMPVFVKRCGDSITNVWQF